MGDREPIAIVGIGCRLPGAADDPASLWALLRGGVDAITPIPGDRFDVDTLYDDKPATPGRIMSRWGGFVNGLDGFDAVFFETSPREAERLDPQQRMLLETACEALDDAGITREAVSGSSTGVYVGMWINEYESRMFADLDQIDFHMTTGSGRYAASGRLSYFLDLLGPSVTIDTACSSSLVAIHLACEALGAGECELALAGGANAIVEPFITIAYSQSKMMAPDGHCKFGDARANGYVRSDGAVTVALKRRSTARADGDRIYAVIRGSAATNDGRSSGFLATPGQAGQENMLRRAYERAGVEPASVQYIEAHGTGTAAGDPVEVGALGAVVGASRTAEPCLVGSIKSNIGHTEGAAGAAGLVKLALALHHGEIPASLHVEEPNPNIPWNDLGIRVTREHRPWPATEGPRRGGVSAFGIAGTNAHVVLEEAPEAPVAIGDSRTLDSYLLAISASGSDALHDLGERYLVALADGVSSISDVCASAAVRRTHLDDRIAVVGSDMGQLADALRRRIVELESDTQRSITGRRVVFVFPGQGSQWVGMGRELLTSEPVFAASMAECDAAIRREAGWSPIEMLSSSAPVERLDDIDVVQPLLFAIQVALAELWKSWGITPDAVVGHSMGEVAAAHVSGALDLADAAAVICRRSILLRRIAGEGAMALVDLPVDEARAAIGGRDADLSIAVSNSPRSTVLSGDPDALRAVVDALETSDVFCRPVNVDVASHSPQVDPLLDELRTQLASITPRTGTTTFRSTVVGAALDGTALDLDYWAANLRQPVMFGDAVAELAGTEPTAFVELSPHPVLVPSIDQVVRNSDHPGIAVGSMRRTEPERAAMLEALGLLYEAGATVCWPAVTGNPTHHVSLPTYPWQRERFWYDRPRHVSARAGGHQLLGHEVRLAADPGTVHWETTLDGAELAFLQDHVVQGSAVYPATGFVELVREATSVRAGDGLVLTDLVLHEALPVDPDRPRAVQIELTATTCRVYSREPVTADETGDDPPWRLDAEMGWSRPDTSDPDSDVSSVSIDDARDRCPQHRDANDHVADMAARGIDYNGVFRSVGEVWIGDGEALGAIDGTASPAGSLQRRIGVLDGCLQVAFATLPPAADGVTFLPIGIDRLSIASLDDAAWSHVRLIDSADDVVRCDVTVTDAAGLRLATCAGLELRRIGSRDQHLAPLLFGLEWQPAALAADGAADTGAWIVYTADGAGDDAVDRLRAAGARCVAVRSGAEFSRLSDDAFVIDPLSVDDHRMALSELIDTTERCAGVVYGWGAALGADAVADADKYGYLAPVALVQALADVEAPPRLWIATRGAHERAPTQALLWGFGRVAANEFPTLRTTLVDLSPAGDDESELSAELRSTSPDRQVSYVGGVRHVARLRRSVIPARDLVHSAASDCCRVAATAPGSLDSLRLRTQARRTPAAGEVEVRVTSAALNFLDVLKAMGICPGIESTPSVALGAEGAGVVVAVGADVDHVAVGDDVVAITSSYRHTSLLASFVTLPAGLVQPQPSAMSAASASATPVAYVTAYYSLCRLARLRDGETVLVHSAAGGVGLAAVELCRHLGATVIATAGSDSKRGFLRGLGIEHVFDSRSTAFGEQVRAATGGGGVDVVLNSLVGEAIPVGVAALAPGGRFVEIGKRDVYGHSRLDMALLKNNIALFVVDLADLTETNRGEVEQMFHEVVHMLSDGRLPPLPTSEFAFADCGDAFRTMARADHIGKLVLTIPPEALDAETPAIRDDATYLITGGLGGLGLAVAERLVERGARHLALLGRSAPGPVAESAIACLRGRGASLIAVAADVADSAQLDEALGIIRREMPPLRGVIHAAGVLADATIGSMDLLRARAALAPKVHGAWNLHEATLSDPLDHFVLFSSVAALLGLTGQSNYAAGNAFLDALAARRRAVGRPARSIAWGPWAEIGLAASTDERGGRLDARGLGSLDPSVALDAFDLMLDTSAGDLAVMSFDASRWADSEPESATLVGDLVRSSSADVSSSASLRELVLALPPGVRRRRAMEDALAEQLAQVLRVSADRIDRHQTMKAMGLDSLMALELRNGLEASTGLTVSATIAWNYPSVTLLAEHVAERMDIPLDTDSGSADIAHERASPSPPDVSAIGDDASDDLEAMLATELAAVDRLLDAEPGRGRGQR